MRTVILISILLSGIQFAVTGCCQNFSEPHLVRVGLTELWNSSPVQVQPLSGAFEWLNGSGEFIAKAQGLQMLRVQGSTLVGPEGIAAPYWILRPTQAESVIRIITAQGNYLKFAGILHFWNEDGQLKIVLESPLEDYLPGVVASEAGKGHHPVFYEVQSIVSRTYSVKTMGKHRMDGFDVCDQTHCQVFRGIQTVNDTIKRACEATEQLILLDKLGRPADAAFHSNCGGQTQNASSVWQSNAHYLSAALDTFCVTSKHATWSKEIPLKRWNEWTIQQQTSPNVNNFKLAARKQFSLPSANFEVIVPPQASTLSPQHSDQTASVLLQGKGFGHGVGLCQEGSMARAHSDQSTWQILEAYYQGIRIGLLQ